MRMQVQRVLFSGRAVLDRGIADLEVHVGATGVTTVFAATGRNGGITGWQIGAGGVAALQSSVVFPAAITRTVSDRIVLETSGPAARLLFGADAAGLMGLGLGASNAIGARSDVAWTPALAGMQTGGPGAVEAILTLSGRGERFLPPWSPARQVVDVERVTVGGIEYVLVASSATHALTSFVRDPETGALLTVDESGALDGLGIRAPTAMETVTVAGTTYAVLAAAGTSSLTVMRVGPGGQLVPTDHVIDTAATRFRDVQALATVRVGELAYVVAGGSDHGISLFLLTPEGRLTFVQSLADTAQLSLANVSAITATVVGGTVHIFAGSQRDAGLTHLTIPAETIGTYRTGSGTAALTILGTAGGDLLAARNANDTLDGGPGTDVLISGPGRTAMRGGAGPDLFVVRANTTRAEILDFQRGLDRLDLSDLPMLRSLGQLTITTTANGARIVYRGTTIEVAASDGRPLTAADLFPLGAMHGPERIPILPRQAVAQAGMDLHGTPGPDRMSGTHGNDSLRGGGGNDTISLVGGDNRVWGGAGDDVIRGGPGNDSLFGEDGNDAIWGWRGANLLDGGPGNDTIHGGRDSDTILGGAGDDVIWTGGGRNTVDGGEGNDRIRGGDGGNLIRGGAGNDTIHGGRGNDSLFGGPGDDRIWSIAGNNEIDGGEGNDLIWGGTGNDTLIGWTGNDQLRGEAGNDLLIGGPGADSLWGGAGADIFAFARGHDTNRIFDFSPAEGDRIHLARALWEGQGNLTVAQVLARFGSVDASGSTVLNFQAIGGTTVILVGFADLTALAGALDLV